MSRVLFSSNRLAFGLRRDTRVKILQGPGLREEWMNPGMAHKYFFRKVNFVHDRVKVPVSWLVVAMQSSPKLLVNGFRVKHWEILHRWRMPFAELPMKNVWERYNVMEKEKAQQILLLFFLERGRTPRLISLDDWVGQSKYQLRFLAGLVRQLRGVSKFRPLWGVVGHTFGGNRRLDLIYCEQVELD